jgi:hypothetical protein
MATVVTSSGESEFVFVGQLSHVERASCWIPDTVITVSLHAITSQRTRFLLTSHRSLPVNHDRIILVRFTEPTIFSAKLNEESIVNSLQMDTRAL